MLPPLLERIHIDIRAREVITGVLFALFFTEIAHEEWRRQAAEFALLVLMFEIGRYIDTKRLQKTLNESLQYAVIAFFVPFVLVFASVWFLVADWVVALIFAIGLSSTALAVVSPLMRREGIDSPVIKNAAMFSEMHGISLLVAFVQRQQLGYGQLVTQVFAIFGFISFTILMVPLLVESSTCWTRNASSRSKPSL